MRSQLFLIPFAVVATVSAPARADVMLSVEQAQQLLFPKATFTQSFFELSTEQYVALRDAIDAPIFSDRIKAWRVSNGGWFIVDVVHGRDDALYYAVGLSADGAVTGIEIMECAGEYSGITNATWRHQFVGARRAGYNPDAVKIFSGTTLSSRHIADGLQRVLTTFDLFMKAKR